MTRKFWSLGLSLAAVYSLLLAPTAQATEATSVEVVARDEILWVEVTTDTAEGLSVKIVAPNRRSGRTLWQTCLYAGTAPGTYRCGIDVSQGSLAQKREGMWVAKVMRGGAQVTVARFSL